MRVTKTSLWCRSSKGKKVLLHGFVFQKMHDYEIFDPICNSQCLKTFFLIDALAKYREACTVKLFTALIVAISYLGSA